MAKPEKTKDETPPQVTGDATRAEPTDELNAHSPDKPDADTRTETESEARDIPPADPEPVSTGGAQTEGFVWADSVEDHDPDKPAKHDTIEHDADADSGAARPADQSDTVPGAETSETTAEAVQPDYASDAAVLQHPLPVPAPTPRRSVFWPAVLGGVIAAMLGFIAGRGDMLDAYFPRADLPEPVDLTPLTQETAALAARVGALESADGSDATDDLAQSVGALESTLAALTARLEEVETRPTPPAPATPAPAVDNSAELAALQSAISDLEARLAEEDARASTEAANLLARAALTRVMTAVENGETFEPALGALEEVAPVEVPQTLRDAATSGVPSMATLRENFPDAARAGLGAARAEVPESDVAGISGFLRRQLSARSVTPREGSDPDAVLSRAEAALRSGDLDTTLAELSALPDASKAAMQGWLEGAQARKNASEAAKALSESLTVN